jgi:hypothetical protein
VTEIFSDELEELELQESAFPGGISKAPDGGLMIDRAALNRGSPHRGFTSTGTGQTTPVGPVLSSLLSAMLPAGAGPSIMARSDKKTVQFGVGLGKEELFYIYARLKRILVG